MSVSTPFARLEQRLNNAVMAHLSNATATLNGVELAGMFDNAYRAGDIGIGMASTQPAFTTLTANVMVVGEAVGQLLTINGTSYYVAAHEPDGTGMSLLLLEVA